MEKLNNASKIAGALLLGAAIGGTLGLLFAPYKGSETRKKIAGQTDDLTDEIKEKFNDFLDEIKCEMEKAKEKADAFIKHSIENAEKFKA
jgi:gas vesicle protein